MSDNFTDVSVGADVKFPTHDVSLTDAKGKVAGLILCNNQGFKDPTQMRISSMPRTPMQMSQGAKGYDDMELPFVAEVQTTMAGGRGNETLSSDRTKFFDSFRLDTTKEYPICAPATIAQAGIAPTSDVEPWEDSAHIWTGGMSSRPQMFRYKFAAETVVTGISAYIRSTETDKMELYYSVLTGTVEEQPVWANYNTIAEQMYSATVTNMYDNDNFVYLPVPGITVEAGEYLYIIFYASKPSFFRFGDNIDKAQVYDGYASWTLTMDNAFLQCKIHTSGEYDAKLFEYKRQLYAVLNETNKNSAKLFMNGWRGVADSNAANLSRLVDATQTTAWDNNAAANCIVLIINGAGEHEEQPWRRVASSASGTLTVSSPWKIAHDTTTEYVVLGSNVWSEIVTLDTAPTPDVECFDKPVTSVAVVNDYVVFAFGDDDYISCYKVDNNTNVFRQQWAITTQKADILCPIVNEQGDLILWRADRDDCIVDYANPPAFTVTTMTFNFDINAEERANLTLQRDRLYSSLWEEVTNTMNDTLLQLTRLRDNLMVEGTRLIGTGTPASPEAGTLVANATGDELISLKNRAIDIVGATGTVASPGYIQGTIQSELQRVVVDITAEEARILRIVDPGGDIMRQILDLTYQITATATESEDSGETEISGYLSAHTNNTSSTAHKYLPANIKCGSTSSRITNIVPYSTPVIPYIMKEDSFGSISDNIYQEIPLAELKAVRAEDNGKTAMHYGVYLYFNLEGGRIERYYDQRIDDVGFNRDEGLPEERQGEVSKLVPYPGRFYAACNAGFAGYSTVMCNNGMGWHEIYRAGTSGQMITDIYIQPVPGNEYADRLWVSVGGYLIAVPIAITPLQQYQYRYFGYIADEPGYVETSWVDFELKDVNKYFHSITIFSDYSGNIRSHQEYDIKVWFRVDDEKTWTYAGNTQAYPNKEIELRYPTSPSTAHDVSGKKIKFKIAMKPNEQYETPRLKAIVINGVLRMPIKRSWNVTFMLEPMSDLRKKTKLNEVEATGSKAHPTQNATLYGRLQYWANSKTHATPLLMRTNDFVSDNCYVFIDPMSIQNGTVQQVMGSGSGEKEYKHIATMTLYEV